MIQTSNPWTAIPKEFEQRKINMKENEPISFSFPSSPQESDDAQSMSSSISDCTASTCSSSDLSDAQVEDVRRQQAPKKKNKRRSRGRRQGSKNGGKKNKDGMTKKKNVEVERISEEEKEKYIAIDCEMVSVRGISTLARVSIVNWYGDTIFNTFVRVEEEVTDYLTFVSGIRQADIESEDAMSFEDCQDAVLEIFRGKVVVGHALRNDFIALNIMHPWHLLRDTAKYEPFMKPCPIEPNMLVAKKLKVLAKNKLDMIIQEDGEEHDSIVDATAAMELYKKARGKWENAIQWKLRKTSSIEKLKR